MSGNEINESKQEDICVQLGRSLARYPKQVEKLAKILAGNGSDRDIDRLEGIEMFFVEMEDKGKLSKEDSRLLTNFIRGIAYHYGAEI